MKFTETIVSSTFLENEFLSWPPPTFASDRGDEMHTTLMSFECSRLVAELKKYVQEQQVEYQCITQPLFSVDDNGLFNNENIPTDVTGLESVTSSLLQVNMGSVQYMILIVLPLSGNVVELSVVMHCEGCAGSVRKTLKKIPGALSCTVDFETQRATVVGNVDRIDVLRRVQKSGKLASLIPKPPPPPPPEPPKEEPKKEEPKAEEKKEEPKKEEEKKEETKPEEKKEEKKEEPKTEEKEEAKAEEKKEEPKKEEAKPEEKKEETEEEKKDEKKEGKAEDKKEEKGEEKKDEGKAEEKKEEAKPEEKKEEAKPEEPPKPKPWAPDFIQAPFYTLTYPSYYYTKAP